MLPLARDAGGAVRVAVTDPLDTAPLDDLRLLFDGADIVLELATQRTILGAINEVYDRGPGSTDALAERRGRGPLDARERDQPGAAGPARVGRGRRADHQARELAAAQRGQGARERSAPRAVRERAARAVPDRQRALRADQAAAEGAPGEHRLAHQDHGPAQHRREAPAPGRPDPAEDRRPRLRRAPLDAAGRLRRARGDAAAAAHPGAARPRPRSASTSSSSRR